MYDPNKQVFNINFQMHQQIYYKISSTTANGNINDHPYHYLRMWKNYNKNEVIKEFSASLK